MKTTEQLALLQDFYRDRLALVHRHVEGAKLVPDYEFNNTYQYIIAREDVHITWVAAAITDLGGEIPTNITALPVPTAVKKGRTLDGQVAVLEDDSKQADVFVNRWRPKIETVTNARHKGMLRIILGEILEHKRFFTLALAGREDLLGRRMPGASTGDGVLPVRWVE